jgi:His-Xaa-Ser system protein HxsD
VSFSEQRVLRFSRATQHLGALQEAAYRLIGIASCKIDATDTEFVCTLIRAESDCIAPMPFEAIEHRFLNLVTDENLRAKVSAETAATRNLLMALAFGAWASPSSSER